MAAVPCGTRAHGTMAVSVTKADVRADKEVVRWLEGLDLL